MKNRIIFIQILIIFVSINFLKANDNLSIAFDAASFYFDDNLSRWELFLSVPDNMFTYKNINDDKNSVLTGKFIVNIKIYNDTRNIIDEDWQISNGINSLNDLKHNFIFGVKSFLLQPGQYNATITAYDENDRKRNMTFNQNIIIPKFDKNRINQSEIQFASYLSKISESKFDLDHNYMKYDYYVIPNPRAEFIGDKSRLIGVIEVYNSDIYAKNGFIRSYKIIDNTGQVLTYSKDTCYENSENILTIFDLSLDTLNSGVYYLTISTIYPLIKPEDSISSSKKFFYYNQNKPPIVKRYFTENELFEKSEFNTMSNEQTDLELNQCLVIANLEEINQAKSLNETKAKQRFLFKFWAKRNSDTLSRWNGTLNTFRENIDFANKFFSYGLNKQGWKTERGRVLLKYGMPTRREITLSTGNERAYEDWFYEDVQGGVNFYFVDISSIGNFILVHSTAKDEPYYPDWYNRYVPTTQDSRKQNDLKQENYKINPNNY